MKTKSIGKIARLPRPLREQLNVRLRNQEPGNRLVSWLNSLPEVRAIVAAQFGSRPISKQNLSEWKHHGFRDWLARREAFEFARNLRVEDLDPQPGAPQAFSARLTQWAAIHYAAAARSVDFIDDDPDHNWRRVRKLCGDAVALRRCDLRSAALDLQRQRFALNEQALVSRLRKTELQIATKLAAAHTGPATGQTARPAPGTSGRRPSEPPPAINDALQPGPDPASLI